ncbi:hypothetical protein [Streptomyces johnsoniae]|uniref:Uncharacterized protein n=1 Tax=Streptomyces johnsoniae TaxID=3075532 RepID=A0ABU2S6H9_9ACTN|nr:hypothetical protein [Streptomyces sp. DSM 41886]MDT0444271.1 hypothetical protein [Streptomyces sp. DSM 41886]
MRHEDRRRTVRWRWDSLEDGSVHGGRCRIAGMAPFRPSTRADPPDISWT